MSKDNKLDVSKTLKEFRKQEESSARRKDALKIDAPFDEAMKKILKAKPEPKKRKK